ncbi:uncharacterized protein TNCV_1621721 [Trichonephila clavipes]|nr:uncharacterized protein TNCV_1621721 [Trichonephila clavipes]
MKGRFLDLFLEEFREKERGEEDQISSSIPHTKNLTSLTSSNYNGLNGQTDSFLKSTPTTTTKEESIRRTEEKCDEAHFWLNGYVSKQNCRIWSEANPQVYVETPLHPEKLTVWCALWAGGILLQKR